MDRDEIEHAICELGRTIAENAAEARSKPLNDPDRVALEQQIDLRKTELVALWHQLTSQEGTADESASDGTPPRPQPTP